MDVANACAYTVHARVHGKDKRTKMVSIAAKREDFTSKDAILDIKYLADRILQSERRNAPTSSNVRSKAATPKDVVKLLPESLRVRFN